MQGYDFHIHGKPYSQDIWKNDAYSDYLNSMYSNAYLNAIPDESYMIIEIHNKMVHYTYMRSKGILDNAEREGSFFAVTVSFKEHYCSVNALYNLLDQIYHKIAKPSFFVQSKIGGCLKYKVQQLEDANVAEQMLMAFDKNVMLLNVRDINYQFDTLHSKETKIVSLKDVDSPEFVDMLLRNRIVVSPMLNSAVKRCSAIESELVAIKTQKQVLLSTNESLQSEIFALTEENKSLSTQLHASASSTEKKYKSRLDQLEGELTQVTNERDSLKQKIQEATSSIELIDQPFQKLTRLLAGRFPENRSQKRNDYLGVEHEVNTESQKPVWRDWVNSILLGLVLVCCCVILAIVLKASSNDNIFEQNSKVVDTEENTYSDTTMRQDVNQDEFSIESGKFSRETDEFSGETEESVSSYDSWSECKLNIKGGSDNLEINKDYSLSVTKNGKPANVPAGRWSVYINEGEVINKDSKFKITDPSSHGKNVMIGYYVDGQLVKQRVCKIL